MSWCSVCPSNVTILAHVAIVYALACMGYLALTRGYGTPLRDSYTQAQQDISRESARRRGRAFAAAGLLAVAFTAAWRPLG